MKLKNIFKKNNESASLKFIALDKKHLEKVIGGTSSTGGAVSSQYAGTGFAANDVPTSSGPRQTQGTTFGE